MKISNRSFMPFFSLKKYILCEIASLVSYQHLRWAQGEHVQFRSCASTNNQILNAMGPQITFFQSSRSEQVRAIT